MLLFSKDGFCFQQTISGPSYVLLLTLQALESFRKQEVDYLIATDVAARGLDIMGVETVVNFHCPRDITMYVHRVGRTARAGREGCAVTFVTERERSLLKSIVWS
jgi:ATP-dependent RNA helicase DDX27